MVKNMHCVVFMYMYIMPLSSTKRIKVPFPKIDKQLWLASDIMDGPIHLNLCLNP